MNTVQYPWEADFYDPKLFDCGAGNADEEKVLSLYISVFGKNPQRILDIGCGTGRSGLAFSRAGHNVHGIDISPVMLESLKLKIKKSTDLRASLTYEVMNLLDLDEKYKSRFDAASGVGDVLTHFLTIHTLEDALRKIYMALKPSGVFITDLTGRNLKRLKIAASNYPKPLYAYPVVSGYINQGVNHFVTMQEFEEYNVDTGLVLSHQRYEIIDEIGTVAETFYKTIRQRLYKPDEISKIAVNIGFTTQIFSRESLSGKAKLKTGYLLVMKKDE
ncbi:MAG: methyltransferase domain-containing protein [Bacteroidetes bacterium]|nr:methyltransferase domain-containing protein [Bacteroidota bacterium]